jgi:leucine dehydrogenase
MAKESLFTVLIKEGLNRFQIHYDWRTDQAVLYSAREWDDYIQWCEYNKSFTVFSPLTRDARFCNDLETRGLFQKYGLMDYLERVIGLMRKGRHIMLDGYYLKSKDIRFICHVHSVKCGINNRSQAVVMGGIRRHEPEEEEIDVIIDGMNLARGMSFKNVAAMVPCGGCKITVQAKPVDLSDLDEVGFLAYANDRCRNTTGPDMRYPPELADVVKKHFSLGFAGAANGPLGPSGGPTAYGTYHAMKQAAKFVFGSESLKGKTVAIQGLGAVGHVLAEYLIQEDARLIVCDSDEKTIRGLKEKYPEQSISVVDPEDIYYVDADIFSPSAIGGIITKERIPGMKFKIILGGANNQLKASSQEEEYDLARELEKAGITFQVAWWHNIGGVMSGYEEFVNQEKADIKTLYTKIEELCSKQTWSNLSMAKELGITPTEMAYKTVEDKIYK